jgi:hypothetical protein
VKDFVSSYAGSNYSSEEESEDDVPDEKQVDLGNVYSQCRAAREAAFVSTVVDISCNENMLGTETKKWDRIGTLDKQLDPEIKECFKGARIEKNGVTVNQFLSCSFDPATLLCITCGREHKVLEGEGGRTALRSLTKISLELSRVRIKKTASTLSVSKTPA